MIEKLYRRHNWKTSFFIFCARKRVLFLFRLSKQNYCYFRLILTYFSPVLHELMNCFCGMVDRRKVFSLISSRDHCKRSSPSRISGTPRAGFEPAQNLSSALVEWSWAVVIITTPRRQTITWFSLQNQMTGFFIKCNAGLKWVKQ